MINVNKIDNFLTSKLHKGINVDERIREEISSLGKVKIFYYKKLRKYEMTIQKKNAIIGYIYL